MAILRLLGLFDRPASRDCLTALRGEPAIPGLTESLAGGSDKDWNIALSRLGEINLVGVNADGSVDCHPLLREYFAVQLRRPDQAERRSGNDADESEAAGASSLRSSIRPTGTTSEAWRAGHRRLYEHLCENTQEGDTPTLEDLQPLYQAVAHGCQAGLQQDACENVYYARIARQHENYSAFKLGALGSDLGAEACFFEPPWSRVSGTLGEAWQAWMLNEAAYRLRALGRLSEALEPMRTALKMGVKQENWTSAAVRASNLSELEQTLGEVVQAERDAAQSVTYADRSGEWTQKMKRLTTHANALIQAGRRAEAFARFHEAEQLQVECHPAYPLLYSLQGFEYCELLLTAAELAAWRVMLESSLQAAPDRLKPELQQSCRDVSLRAAQTLKWYEQNKEEWLLDIALDHLTLGRAALYEAILSGSEISTSASEIEAAVTGVRRAGHNDHLPRGLLTRAWLRFLAGHATGPDSAQSDLDEAWEIAERGSMKLFLADIHLYRARLFGLSRSYARQSVEEPPTSANVDEPPSGDGSYPWESPAADLAAAEKLINDCDYHRRDEELADAKAALLQ